MFAVQSSSLCARSQTTTLRTNKAQKKIQRCQAVRVVVVFVVVLSSSFCEEKNARKTRSLSFWGDRRICVSASFFLPFSFLCTRSLAVTYPRSLSSLSLSDYHRSKSTRSLSKRWCVLFSMIRFCFFFALSRSRFCPYLSVKSVCMCERESVFFQSRVFPG